MRYGLRTHLFGGATAILYMKVFLGMHRYHQLRVLNSSIKLYSIFEEFVNILFSRKWIISDHNINYDYQNRV